MPTIQTPDGRSWQFPDGMDQGAMAAAIEQQIATENPKAGPRDGMVGDMPRRIGTAAIDAVMGYLSPIRHRGGEVTYEPGKGIQISPPTTQAERERGLATDRAAMFNQSGVTEYVPETFGGRIGQSAMTGALMSANPMGFANMTGGTAPAMASQVMPAVQKMAAPMIAGAGAGAGAQIGAEASQKFLPGLPPQIGALAGGLMGGYGAQKIGQFAIGSPPGAISPEAAQLAQTAREGYDIPLRGGQISENPAIRKKDAILQSMPYSGYQEAIGKTRDAFNRAVGQPFGADAPRLTPEVMGHAAQRIGAVFDDVAAQTKIPLDPPQVQKLNGILEDLRLSETSGTIDIAKRQIVNILNTAAQNKGVISGDAYQAMTKRKGPIDRLLNGEPGQRAVGQALREFLDDGLMQNAPHSGVIKNLQEARMQWKALRTVEDAMRGADDPTRGIATTLGDVNPAKLRAAVQRSYPNVDRTPTGQVPLIDLSRIGERFLNGPRSSGTPEGMMAMRSWTPQNLFARHVQDPIVGGLLKSDLYTNRLIQSGLNPSLALQRPHLLTQALMAEQIANRSAASNAP